MQGNMIVINNNEFAIKEYNGERIVTFKDIDMAHGRRIGTADKNFRSNKDKFIEGKDYYFLNFSQNPEIRGFKIAPRGITVFTHSGYLMIVKSFTDDLSWQIQRQLVNNYFNSQLQEHESENQTAELSPAEQQTEIMNPAELPIELQMIDKLLLYAKRSHEEMQDIKSRVVALESRKPDVMIVEPDAQHYLEATNTTISKNHYSITSIAEAFGMSARILNKYLYNQGVICPCGNGWDINKRIGKESYVILSHGQFTNAKGEKIDTTFTMWTHEGMTFLCEFLKDQGFAMSRSIKPYDNHGNRKRKTKAYKSKKRKRNSGGH